MKSFATGESPASLSSESESEPAGGRFGSGSGGHAMSPPRMFSKIFTGVSAWNGGTPTNSSNTTAPSAHQSTSGPYGSHINTSGAR